MAASPSAALSLCLLLLGCSTTQPPLKVDGGHVDDTSCSLTVDGVSVRGDDRVLARFFVGMDRRREVHISGQITTPYRCIGGVVFALQRAGFKKIGFIAEAAAAETY